MDEFAQFDRAMLIREIYRLRKIIEAEQALVRQVEGANSDEVGRLIAEVESQKWAATRHQHRAEALKEVIAMMIGGAR